VKRDLRLSLSPESNFNCCDTETSNRNIRYDKINKRSSQTKLQLCCDDFAANLTAAASVLGFTCRRTFGERCGVHDAAGRAGKLEGPSPRFLMRLLCRPVNAPPC